MHAWPIVLRSAPGCASPEHGTVLKRQCAHDVRAAGDVARVRSGKTRHHHRTSKLFRKRLAETLHHLAGELPRGDDGAGVPKARARAIASLAATVVSDPDLLSPVGVGDLDESVRRLKSLPGIGEWTAQYIAMRVLQEPDAFPASDVGLLRAMTKRGANGEKRPTPDELLERAATWRPWRAYAAQHLWVSDADAR